VGRVAGASGCRAGGCGRDTSGFVAGWRVSGLTPTGLRIRAGSRRSAGGSRGTRSGIGTSLVVGAAPAAGAGVASPSTRSLGVTSCGGRTATTLRPPEAFGLTA
jgi:hypothetical protein